MTKKVTKTRYSQLNDKKFYFPNDIISLHFGHPSLKEISEFKTEKGQKIKKILLARKRETFSYGKNSTSKKKKTRLLLLDNILKPATKNSRFKSEN